MRGIQLSEYVKVRTHSSTRRVQGRLTLWQVPHELKVTELPDPKPGPNDYLIEVHAAATNFFDILQIQGKYQNQPRKPS